MPDVITALDQLTPERLSEILYTNGHLSGEEVTRVTVSSEYTTPPSIIAHVHLTFSGDTAAPDRLLLKIPKPDTLPADPREVMYYNVLADSMFASPSVPCYDAVYDDASGTCHILLKDVSDTHGTVPWPLSPGRRHAEQIIDALAALHGYCWNDPRIGSDLLGALPSMQLITDPADVSLKFPHFVDFMGERLSTERRRLFETVFAIWPDLFNARISGHENLTIIHRDAHAQNILLPHDSREAPAYLIDWQTYQPWISAQDLAYHFTLFWYPEQRSLMELDLLKLYYSRLLEHGVPDYDWDAFWYDYRLSVIRCLYVPAIHGGNPDTAWLWWPQLQKVVSAFQDLDCRELLASHRL